MPESLPWSALAPNRTSQIALAGILLCAVLALDLLWSIVAGSTGTILYGLVDEPAHLATCALALLAIAAINGRMPPRLFILAALVASVAIDVDHIPRYIGSEILTGTAPRPYSHSLATVAAMIGAGFAVGTRKYRMLLFGLAFGIILHLYRDLATGPGIPLFWPLSTAAVGIPYAVFACGLVAATAAVVLAPQAGRHRSIGALSGTALLLVILMASSARAAAPEPISLGVYLPDAASNPSEIDAYAREVGSSPVLVSSYRQWGDQLFRNSELAPIWVRGAVPLVTWEPWTGSQRGISLAAIANGRYDRYLRRSARAAVAWGKPVFLRFAHEMNGTWYPWGRGHGITPALYKRTWRHVVTVFRRAGANNVRWVWSPYVSNHGHLVFSAYFPGNRWIDWIGLDGFNWATGGAWQSFDDIFAASYNRVKRLSDRPIMIPETGSTEEGGSKAAWVSQALDHELPRMPGIRALVWFSESGIGINSRVDSTPSALAALREAVRSWRYRASRGLLLRTPLGPHF